MSTPTANGNTYSATLTVDSTTPNNVVTYDISALTDTSTSANTYNSPTTYAFIRLSPRFLPDADIV